MAVAAAPEPGPPKLTAGAEVQPLPALVIVIEVTAPLSLIVDVAVAPLQPPPLTVTVGSVV